MCVWLGVSSSLCVCLKSVRYVCAGMRSWSVSVPGLRGKEDDPAQLTVSHAGQNNTITLLLTRTWHTSHLLPPEPHAGRHACTWTDIHIHTHTHTLGKSFKSHTGCFSAMAHLRPLLPSLSSMFIYLWACRGGSHHLAHFLCLCLSA